MEIEEEIKKAFHNNKHAIWAARNYRPWNFFLCSSRMFLNVSGRANELQQICVDLQYS